MINESLFDREEFEAWISSHPDNEVVGYNKTVHGCPITNYLLSKEEVNEASVGVTVSSINRVYVSNPVWVTKFVKEIDKKKSKENITAAKAKAILKY